MRSNVYIDYKDQAFFFRATKKCWTIFNSYSLKGSCEMEYILEEIAKDHELPEGRTIENMIEEWRVHNMLYAFHILKERTRTVDLEGNQHKLLSLAYKYLSKLYWFI